MTQLDNKTQHVNTIVLALSECSSSSFGEATMADSPSFLAIFVLSLTTHVQDLLMVVLIANIHFPKCRGVALMLWAKYGPANMFVRITVMVDNFVCNATCFSPTL